MNTSAALARSITWHSSKQSYWTARLLVDKDRVDDCYRAYAFFRWADDMIDVICPSQAERIAFIRRQKMLVDRLYRGERLEALTPEEGMIADLIRHDHEADSGLQSFIRHFLAVLEFDAARKGRPITQDELTWYSSCLGKAVTDCIQYFIGHGHVNPASEGRYLAGTAAHITHMLRDMVQDIPDGFINVPDDYLEEHGIRPEQVDDPAYRDWVQDQVALARQHFDAGKWYLDQLPVLRCKIAGYWYCARFEWVLDTIERDGYVLREQYHTRRKLRAWVKIAWLAISVTVQHLFRRHQSDAQTDLRSAGDRKTMTTAPFTLMRRWSGRL